MSTAPTPALRAKLEVRQVGYVLAIGCNRRVPTAFGLVRADRLTANLPKRAWQRLSAGPGAKGQRYYTQCWWLLVRRHRGTGELAFHRCYSSGPMPLRELVRVA